MSCSKPSTRIGPGWGGFPAFGTTASFATTTPEAMGAAEAVLRGELAEIELCCSRFRADLEISRAHETGGYPAIVSPLLAEVIKTALDIARDTDGAVDPTVGAAVIELGYDRDFSEVPQDGTCELGVLRPAPGWRCIELDPGNRLLRIPQGVKLDLGSTAKAFAADRAASRIAEVTGSGVLVNLGGDISLAGPAPFEGWPVALALACTTRPEDAKAVVAIWCGGLASSGTAVRTWQRGGRRVHHIVDPATGTSADSCWQLASVTAPSCVAANAASTAAIVWGEAAPAQLSKMLSLSCRLVRHDGTVVRLGGWPEDADSSPDQCAKAV